MIEKTLETILNEISDIKSLIFSIKNNNTSENNVNEFLNTNEASLYLDISKSHIYKLTMLKTLKFHKPNGKKIYFKKTDLDYYLNSKISKSINDLDIEANRYISKQIN